MVTFVLVAALLSNLTQNQMAPAETWVTSRSCRTLCSSMFKIWLLRHREGWLAVESRVLCFAVNGRQTDLNNEWCV